MPPTAAAAMRFQPVADDDPVWRAAMAAPLDDTPDTDEEREAIEAVKRSGFRSVPGAVVTSEIERRAR